jgi:hypothetical protein
VSTVSRAESRGNETGLRVEGRTEGEKGGCVDYVMPAHQDINRPEFFAAALEIIPRGDDGRRPCVPTNLQSLFPSVFFLY